MNAVQSLYTVAIALCLFSTGILNSRAAQCGQRLSWFSVYLALEAACFVFELLIAHPAAPLKALWLGLLMATSLLIAPSLWLAIRESVDGVRPALSSVGWRHRIVVIAGGVLTLPLLETAHFGSDFSNPDRVGGTLFEPLIHETMLLCLGIVAVQIPYYLWRCRQLLLSEGTSGVPTQSHAWLQIPLIIVGTTWLLGVVRTLAGMLSQGSQEFFVLVALIDVSVTVGCVYLIVTRLIATRTADTALPDVRQGTSSSREDPPTAIVEPRYAKSQLDVATRARIVRKLEAAFGTEAIYRDSAVSLGSLSRHLNESEHYVSQVISQDLATSFFELVSLHRIEQAKRLLVQPSGQTVLEVAFAVGFNAKSTFNNAFRRHTGMTPRQFRGSHASLSSSCPTG